MTGVPFIGSRLILTCARPFNRPFSTTVATSTLAQSALPTMPGHLQSVCPVVQAMADFGMCGDGDFKAFRPVRPPPSTSASTSPPPHSPLPAAASRSDGQALGGADLGVAQQPPDHFHRCPARNKQRGDGVAQVVAADIGDFGVRAHPLPKPFEINHRLARDIAGEEEGAALGHCVAAQADQGDGLVRDWYAGDTALFGVGRLFGPDRQIKIVLLITPRRPTIMSVRLCFKCTRQIVKISISVPSEVRMKIRNGQNALL
jgi:hypothetical protein